MIEIDKPSGLLLEDESCNDRMFVCVLRTREQVGSRIFELKNSQSQS